MAGSTVADGIGERRYAGGGVRETGILEARNLATEATRVGWLWRWSV
jgi:hypothetical protein